MPLCLDLHSISDFETIISEAEKYFGAIDILVNSAGVHSTKPMTDFFNTTEDEYDSIMNINLKGTYFITQSVAKRMIENKIRGHILNISSSTANEPAWSAYRLSKNGLDAFTKGLAQTLSSYGIIVNGIAPGSTATSLLDYKEGETIATEDNIIGRMIVPDEIAIYAKLFVSDLGNMISGSVLYISGGRGTFDIR